MADFCTTRLLDQHDRHATWTNIITSGNLGGVKYPLHFETDREILDVALPTIGLTPPARSQNPVDQKHAALWPKSNARRRTLPEPENGATI